MFSPRITAATVAALVTLGVAAGASAELILISEDFHAPGSPGMTDQPMSVQGWFAYYDSGAGTVDRSDTTTSDNNIQMKNSYLVGSGGAPESHTYGDQGCVLFRSAVDTTAPGASPVKGLFGATLDVIDAVRLDDYTDITFSWEQWNIFEPEITAQVAIQVDSTWYVSAELISNPNADASSNANSAIGSWYLVSNNTNNLKTFTIDPAGSWFTLSFTPGAPMTVGSTSTELPATGTVDGVGLYGVFSTSGTAYLGFDNFEVTASPVPEPTTVALLLMGGLAACMRRRRG